MKYLMLVCTESAARFEQNAAQEDKEARERRAKGEDEENGSFPWLDDVIARGVRLDGNRVRPPSEATTVRVRAGDVLLSDGPFAETKEAIVGYDVLNCRDLDEAIEVASKHPVAGFGMIEVRPIWD